MSGLRGLFEIVYCLSFFVFGWKLADIGTWAIEKFHPDHEDFWNDNPRECARLYGVICVVLFALAIGAGQLIRWIVL